MAPRFRWRRSRWLRYCPVALQEGMMVPGKAEFACGWVRLLPKIIHRDHYHSVEEMSYHWLTCCLIKIYVVICYLLSVDFWTKFIWCHHLKHLQSFSRIQDPFYSHRSPDHPPSLQSWVHPTLGLRLSPASWRKGRAVIAVWTVV